jgi:hypothetical protein
MRRIDEDETTMCPEEYYPAEEEVAPVVVSPSGAHFDKHLGNVVMVNLRSGMRPITGRLVSVDDVWITIQKRDGDEVDIKKKAVDAIGEVKPYPTEQEATPTPTHFKTEYTEYVRRN